MKINRNITREEAAGIIYDFIPVDITKLETSKLKKLAFNFDNLVSARKDKSAMWIELASVEIYKIIKVSTFGFSTDQLEAIIIYLDIYNKGK